MNEDILLTDKDIENGIEIEYLIVSNVKVKHETYIKTKKWISYLLKLWYGNIGTLENIFMIYLGILHFI